jgi:GMP synthase (glutamine-hydrolysing)
MRRRILVVKTGTTHDVVPDSADDFEDWIAAGLGEPVDVCRVAEGESLPRPDAPAAAVVTGSSAMVSHRLPWSERTAAWLAGAVDAGTPVLGICYGHQLLAHALGGVVGPNPHGREIGTVTGTMLPASADDPLLGGLGPRFEIQATHLESVLSLPARATTLATSARDDHFAFRVDARPAWGVQFHPEFSLDVMREYVEARRGILEGEGRDVDALIATTRHTPVGSIVLRRFGELVGAGVAV